MRKAYLLFAGITALVGLSATHAIAEGGLKFIIKTPVDFTVTSRSPSGQVRVGVLEGGAVIETLNLGPNDEIVVSKIPDTEPEATVCNHAAYSKMVEFYSCTGGGCNCTPGSSGYAAEVTVTLQPGQCHTDHVASCSRSI
jgi:hypothetical protein